MPCRIMKTNQGIAIVYGSERSSGRRSNCVEPGCGTEHSKLCDWPLGEGKTCDRPLCARHAHHVGPDKDYCPAHHAESMKGTPPQKTLF